MKKKKGFTLVELLAVIVILAVILVIAVPQIMDIIKESRKGTLISSAKLIAASAESTYMSNQTLGIEKTITCSDVSKLNSEDYESCTITFDSNGKAKVTIVGKGKFEGMSVCSATRETGEVSSECSTDVACFAYEEVGEQVTSFDINEEACKTYFVGKGSPADEAETVCTGGEVDGFSLKDEIDALIQDGSEEAITQINELKTEGLISIQYVDLGISITGYSSTCPKDVIIPSKIDNKTVVEIGDYAFTTEGVDPSAISNDLLYENYEVNTLNMKAYSDSSLQPINIPNYGIGITSVTIPNSVTTIGSGAFHSNQLTSVTIPNSVTTIGFEAFSYNQLTSVTIPNSVTTIGSGAFSYNQIIKVNFPTTPLTIGCGAFEDNPIYDTLEYPSNITAEDCPT